MTPRRTALGLLKLVVKEYATAVAANAGIGAGEALGRVIGKKIDPPKKRVRK